MIEYAHQQGVLHRDLKPSNVLIDARGDAKVTDFGLAKQLENDQHLTQTDQILGTPSYMSPEQAEGHQALIGPTTDVYSLGAVLYHLLTGRPPFAAATQVETLQQVIDHEPVSPRLLEKSLPKDLETICQKCLQKEPHRRYARAEELAEDLGRFQENRPILARPISRPARLWRWCRRRPLVAALGFAFALSLVGGTAFSAYYALQADQHAKKASQHLKELDEALTLAETQALIARKTSYLSDMKLAYRYKEEGRYFDAKLLVDRQIPNADEEDLRELEWRALDTQIKSQFQVIGRHEGKVWNLDFFPDRKKLATVGEDGCVRIWDLENGRQIRVFRLQDSPIFAVAVSPNGKWIAYGSEPDEDDRTFVSVIDAESGEFLARLNNHPSYIRTIQFSPDGRYLVSGSTFYTVCLWAFEDGLQGTSREVPPDKNPDCHYRLEFLEGGEKLLMEYNNRCGFRVWDVEALTPVADYREKERGHSREWTYHEPSSLLVSRIVSGRKVVELFDARNEKKMITKLELPEFAECLEISPEGRILCIGGASGLLQFWKLTWSGSPDDRTIRADFVTSQQRHQGAIFRIRFLNEEELITIGHDGRIVKSSLPGDVTAVTADRILSEGASPVQVAISPDQGYLLWSDTDKWLHLKDRAAGHTLAVEKLPDLACELCWSADGRHFAAYTTSGHLHSWELVGDEVRRYFVKKVKAPYLPHSLIGLVLSPNGGTLYLSGEDGGDPNVRVWETRERREREPLPTQFEPDRLAVSPNDRYLVAAHSKIHVFDRRSGERLHQFALGGEVTAITFATKEDVLVAGYMDGIIRHWDLKSGNLLKTLSEHRVQIRSIIWSHDGRTMISGDSGGSIRLWDDETGEPIGELIRFSGNHECVQRLFLSPDEAYLDVLVGKYVEKRRIERLWFDSSRH